MIVKNIITTLQEAKVQNVSFDICRKHDTWDWMIELTIVFSIPRPDLSISNDVPNACNRCHQSQSNEQSLKDTDLWCGDSPKVSSIAATIANPDKIEDFRKWREND